MVHYNRFYESEIHEMLRPGKVLVIYGPRQVGKTTLIKTFLKKFDGKYYLGSGEDMLLREIMESESIERIKNAFSGYNLIVIDEAQKIHNIGLGLKMLVDHLPEIPVIASGSSSFELSTKIGEPLTGRQRQITMFPVAALELTEMFGPMRTMEMKEQFMVYGSYPEILVESNDAGRRELLISLRDSYLFKDILELENIKNSRKLSDLLKLIAFQVGREVSLNELSNSLGIAKQTVARYLDLLEKTFIIKQVRGFSRNLRKEVTKTCRYYFWDNGIRNAIINNFNRLDTRDDIGMLWENYLFIERIKKQAYHRIFADNYFWRTYDRQEIDLVEERDGRLFGFEFKWGNKKVRPPRLWLDTYDNAEFMVINQENYLSFIT